MLGKLLEKRDSPKALYFLLGISLAMKIVLLFLNRPFNSDGILYITAAQYFAEGNFAEGLAVYPMPLYSLLITGVHFVIPDWELTAKLISTTSMVLVIIPLYLLTTHLFNRRVAFWACLALALAPVPNDWSVDVIRGPIFVFFAVLTVYVAQMAIDLKSQKHFVITALLVGISFLFRIEGVIILFFFGGYGIYLILNAKKDRNLVLKGFTTWLAVLVVLVVFACGATYIYEGDFNRVEELAKRAEHIVSLDFLKNYHIIYNQLYTLEEHSPNSDTNRSFAEVARHFMFLVYVIGEAQVFFKVLFPLFIIPFFLGLKKSFDKRQAFLLGLICFYLFVMYVFYIDRNYMHKRFLFAPVVLAFPWVGAGLEIMFSKLKKSFHPKMYFAVFFALFLISPSVESVHSLAEEDNVLRKAGTWLKQHKLLHESKVLTNESRAPFFAGIRYSESVFMDSEIHDVKEIEKNALRHNADIILLQVSNDDEYVQGMTSYEKLKIFRGKKRDVYIFCRSNTIKN